MITAPSSQSDFERQVEFDFLRATEIAALNTLQWRGKGQKETADEAACDAIRGMLDKEYMSRDLARGENLVFTATGISNGPLLRGVEVNGSIATTHSVIMRARSGTIRFVEGHHNLERKTIHLRSTHAERRL